MTLTQENPGRTTSTQGRHVLSDSDRRSAWSPEARDKRRQTLAERRENRLLDVVDCTRWGMVPGAVADYLGISDVYTHRLLREAKRRGILAQVEA